MGLQINDTFKGEKAKSTNQPIYLYTIHEYNGVDNLRLAEWDADIVFDSLTYSKFPISHEVIEENSQGEISGVKVMLANVSRLIQAYLELGKTDSNYNWRGKKVTIKLVWANQLADADAFVDFVFYIDSYKANEKNAEFALTPKLDVLDVTLPSRKYSRNYCMWKFKSSECGYAGAETECNKTKVRCKALSNFRRFGGFPSINTRRLYI